MQLYVKATSNCPTGMPLSTFQRLSPEWTGDQVILPFGEDDTRSHYRVLGWTDLFTGRPCPVHVARVRTWRGQEGYLVYGGNSGVRVLDGTVVPTPGVDDHLPRGRGYPVIWVDDLADLPTEVQAIVTQHEKE